MTNTKKYWKGFEDLFNEPGFVKLKEKEFAEHIPVDKFLGNDLLDATSTNRRDFLKFLGFSVSAAALAACEAPVNKAIPYLVKPEEITPGVANWYASTYSNGIDYCGILVKTREGRPVKIEGNKLSSVSKGAVNARVQSSVLSLYDSSRLPGPTKDGEPTTWDVIDKDIKEKLEALTGRKGKIRILTSSLASPSTKKVFDDFAAKYKVGERLVLSAAEASRTNNPENEEPLVKHIIYDAVSYYGMLQANLECFGKRVVPSYRFDKAGIIVSFGADFLANWVSPIEFTHQYGLARKLGTDKKMLALSGAEMAKHIQFESNLSLTGSNADIRIPIKPSQQGPALLTLYNEIAKLTGRSSIYPVKLPDNVSEKVTATAKQLWKSKGKALVVAGSNNIAIQTLVNNINELLDSYGNTIDMDNHSLLLQSDDAEVTRLIRDMNAGDVQALFLYNVNPAYTLPNSGDFIEGLKKVELSVSFADRLDETASLVNYVCPDHHFLESWNDANPKRGHYSLCQPAIAPLFNTRSTQESLLKWAGVESDYYSYIKKYWEENVFPVQTKGLSFTSFWNKCLHDGVFETKLALEENPEEQKDCSLQSGVVEDIKKRTLSGAERSGELELLLYEKTGIGNGSHANNPWLQELPDPVSRVCWDNYLTMNPKQMKELGFNIMQGQEQKAEVVELTANAVTKRVPVFPQPGQAYGTVGLALGYGRKGAGKAGNDIGVNAYPFVSFKNDALDYAVANAKISNSVDKYNLAATQYHHTMMGRATVRETTLEEYIKDPKSNNPDVLLSTADHKKKKPDEINLWQSHPKEGHHWNLSVDLNSCIGCGACVVGCTSENNVPVVGKDEIRRSREMHWIRIDRYYSSDEENKPEENRDMDLMEIPSDTENLEVVFQPIMCQHCNHAPCETVCPVAATTHSSEGLNQMAYNRCVGTKYCQNNCPYKVRRFNWFSYSGDARFENVNPSQDDLGKMVLNPDVVVRSRGVMEKCTMCVHKIQEGKLNAKKEGRKLKDGEIQTACAAACPVNAIKFGDGNDADSEVAQLKNDPRRYYLLEELDTQPSVHYLTKVRNK